MRIASQNVAKRLPKSGHALISKLVGHRADVIALQEVTAAQLEGWHQLLVEAGFVHIALGDAYGREGGALLASQLPASAVRLLSGAAGARVAGAVVDGIPIASVYFPTGKGADGWASMHDNLIQSPLTRDFIIIGDFQMAVAECEISSGTFGRWRKDAAFVLMQTMLLHWRDAFRTVHGMELAAYSHLHSSGARWLNDHAFIPPNVNISGCFLDWSPIAEGLSDHAALIVDVHLEANSPTMLAPAEGQDASR